MASDTHTQTDKKLILNEAFPITVVDRPSGRQIRLIGCFIQTLLSFPSGLSTVCTLDSAKVHLHLPDRQDSTVQFGN